MKIIKAILWGPAGFYLLSSTSEPNVEPAWDSGVTYSTGSRVIALSGFSSSHPGESIFESLVDQNLNYDPNAYSSGATIKWRNLGPANKWAMFDNLVGTMTESSATGTFTVVLSPDQIVNSLALLKVVADTIDVTMTYQSSTVYSKAIDLTTGAYYRYPGVNGPEADIVLLDLPAHKNSASRANDCLITVTFTSSGKLSFCGNLVIGELYSLGETQYSPKLGIIDYSLKNVDAFGNYSVLQRKYSKRLAVVLELPSSQVDEVFNILAEYRTTPLVWIGADDRYRSMFIWGFYKDFEIDVAYPSVSFLSLSVEGLA